MDFGPPIVTNSHFDFQRQFLESKKDKSVAGREKKMNKSTPFLLLSGKVMTNCNCNSKYIFSVIYAPWACLKNVFFFFSKYFPKHTSMRQPPLRCTESYLFPPHQNRAPGKRDESKFNNLGR